MLRVSSSCRDELAPSADRRRARTRPLLRFRRAHSSRATESESVPRGDGDDGDDGGDLHRAG